MSRAYIGLLVTGMLCTGAANSLFSKYQDNVCVSDCHTEDPRLFEQPVWQTLQMFLGECFCMIVFKLVGTPTSVIRRRLSRNNETRDYDRLSQENEPLLSEHESPIEAAVNPVQVKEDAVDAPRATSGPLPVPMPPVVDEANIITAKNRQLQGKNTFLLALPAIFDLTATTLMNIGLLFTPVSVYQMTRSALVLWVGLFSVIYLDRKLNKSEIVSLFLVCLGVFIVGLSSAFSKDSGKPIEVAKPITPLQVVVGISIILFAQIFTAAQFVLEEKIMGKYAAEPLRVVGYEGIFGFLTTFLVMIIGYIAVGRTTKGQHGYFDAPDGFHQMLSTKAVWISSIAICISIGCFNFVVRLSSHTIVCLLFWSKATQLCQRFSNSSLNDRHVQDDIDLGSQLVPRVASRSGHVKNLDNDDREQFKGLQVLGFCVLVIGTTAFNGLIKLPFIDTPRKV